MLREVHETYTEIEEIEILEDWVEKSDELSNASLKRAIEKKESTILKKALSWSENVNQKINALSFADKKPFEGVKEGLAFAHEYADVAIVSSANLQAVLEEWEMYGLLEHVDLVLAQDTGSKAFCIQELKKKGYGRENVLMTGDALGDYEAAKKNEVFYFPICVRHEKESWEEFQAVAVKKLLDHTYAGDYQEKKIKEFTGNLEQKEV